LSRAFVEFGGDGVEVVLGEGGEVAAFGKYWRSSPLVFSLEPRCQGLRGVAEVDGDTGGHAEAGVGGHLLALVPGERAAELFGQRGDVSGQGVGDDVGAVTVGSSTSMTNRLWRSTSVAMAVMRLP
jgi:hypothetical protein